MLFTFAISVYVSIPDFPYKERSWQVNLWNDPSGWWSEMTWIIAFAVFVSVALLFRSWFLSLRPAADLVFKSQLAVLLTVLSWDIATIAFMLYFKPNWPGFYEYFVLDRTGTLHGLFYITTAHIGVLAVVFGLALTARIVSINAARLGNASD